MDPMYNGFYIAAEIGWLSASICVLIYIVLKSNKKLLYDNNNERYNHFIWILISIFLSFIDSLIFVSFDNNLTFNWIFANIEYTNMMYINTIRTTADGIAILFYMLSKFTFYIAFSSHIKYLSNKDKNNKIYIKLSKIIAIISGTILIIGGIIYFLTNLMVIKNQENDLFCLLIRNITTFIVILFDLIYCCFIMYQYYILINYPFSNNKEIKHNAIKGIILLFIGSILTLINILTILFNVRIFYPSSLIFLLLIY